VQIRDKVNPETRYKLSKTAIAGLSVPISSDLKASAPDSIALWDYNDVSGIWENMGGVKKEGDKYVGITHRFSSVNTDVAITGGTCIYLTDNILNSIFPGAPCDVTITVPTSGAPRIFHATITALDPNLTIARLPLNTDITIEVRRGTDVVAARLIHTASTSSGTASDINPANPETFCTTDYYKKDPPLGDVALNTPFLSRISTPTNVQALAYYKAIGALTDGNNGQPADGILTLAEGETLDQWKTRNGFTTSAADDAHASYFNAGDLGLYRAMHQKGSGSHVAFYVSNFGSFANADDNVFGPVPPVPNATVAMEYDYNPPATGGRGMMKFYLFTGPTQTLDNAVDLDGNGLKFIPGLCIECHGGRETD
jgi:hypothetical protein